MVALGFVFYTGPFSFALGYTGPMSDGPQIHWRWLRLSLFALIGLTGTAATVCWLCASWPVTTYKLERVAEGPFAPGHVGQAWLPHERPPSSEEVSNRIVVCLASIGICAAVGIVFFVRWYTGPPSTAVGNLTDWNLAGLEGPGRVASDVDGARLLPSSKESTNQRP